MKTLLIYPPFHRLHGLPNRFFPIGLGYLAGALKAAGKPAAIYNAENYENGEKLNRTASHTDVFECFEDYLAALDNPDHYVWKETREMLAQYKPDIVGLTVKSCMIPGAQVVSRIVKEMFPDVPVIWGGPHPSIQPDETIGFDNVDFVARHEGEQTIVEFVEMMESGRQDWHEIPGLVWKKDDGEVVHNSLRLNSPECDEIPFPDKNADLLEHRYNADHFGVMFSSRGCPWPCTFCDSRGVWTRKLRYRSSENIIAEMDQLYREKGVRDFYFWDDTFTPNRKVSTDLFQKMIANFQDQDRDITWVATTRCDCVDDELAALMRDSGCRLITYGIETGSPSMMEILKKGITHDKVFHAQRVMEKAGIPWDAFFMIGFPDETPETIEETMELIRKLKCVNVSISIFTPYPGTEMYDRAYEYGLIETPINWRHFSHQSPKNHFVKNIDQQTFSHLVEQCLHEIDELNDKRYRNDRLRFYAKNPVKAARKIYRMVSGVEAEARVI